MAPFAVYADDYEYIPISDIEQYNAYKFWSLYGYSLDYTNTISYNESYTGSYTYSGTVTGTLNGQELTTYNISLTSTLSTLDDDTAVTFGSNGALFGFGSSGDVLTLYIDPAENDSIEQYSQAPFSCNATGNHVWPNGQIEYDSWACVPYSVSGVQGTYQVPAYELTLGGINLDTTQNGYINVNIRETGSGSGGASGTISLNESESVSGSGSISLNGTSTTTGHKTYNIPSLTYTSINNTFNNMKRFYTYKNDPFIISFLSPYQNNFASSFVEVYDNNDNLLSDNYHSYENRYIGGYKLITFSIFSNDDGIRYLKFKFPNSLYQNIIPIYCGSKNKMSDKLYRFLFNSDRTDELLETGNSNSQQAITNNESMTNSFSQASDGIHNIETTWENNLDTNLQNVPTSSSMYNNNKFIATANWVRTQFERIVLNTPFELLLVFSLILGIALVLIGKVR